MYENYKFLKSNNRARITVDDNGNAYLARDFYNNVTGELIIEARTDIIDLNMLSDLRDSFVDLVENIDDLITDTENKIADWVEANTPEPTPTPTPTPSEVIP